MRYAPHKYAGGGPFRRVYIWRSKYPAPGVWTMNAEVAEFWRSVDRHNAEAIEAKRGR